MEDNLLKPFKDAEVFSLVRERREAIFEANKLKSIKDEEIKGVSLRIIEDGRLGFSSSLGDEPPESIIDRARRTLSLGIEADFYFPEPEPTPDVRIFDERVPYLGDDEMIKMGEGLIDRIRKDFPDLLCYVKIERGRTKVSIKNTKGEDISYEKTFMGISLEGVLVRGEDILFVGDGEISCSLISDAELICDRVLLQLERARERARIKSGNYPVIFSPLGVSCCLMPPLVFALSGKNVIKGSSPLAGRRGERVFTKALSLYDDGRAPLRPHTRPVDDEGIPSRRTDLIREGEVVGFLLDIRTAVKMGERSTGNASRTLLTLPSPSPTSIIIEEGEASLEEMVQNIKEGVLVDEVMGASQGNIMGGEFSGNLLLGYKIENGKIVGRLKDTLISGNIYEALKDAVVGKGGRWVGSSLRTPPILCPSLSISSKG